MRMKLISGLVMALAFGATAHATQFVTNGDFSTVTGSAVTGANAGKSFEFDGSQPSGDNGAVTGWSSTSTSGYNILFNAANATTAEPLSRFSETGQDLRQVPSNSAAFGMGSTNQFMALDGASGVQGALTQQINGLVAGQTYTLTFDWAADQLQDRTGSITEDLLVSLGSQSHTTETLAYNTTDSHSATVNSAWVLETMTFTATSSSEVLSFLSQGTPSGDPPMALLDNVSLTNNGVPEPATWGLMIVGFGGVGATLRRRRAASTFA